jgi:hypothetical protein
MTWQPISTAPKDGQGVIIAHANGVVRSCLYEDGKYQINHCGLTTVFYNVTHWQPLPTPPEQE